MLCCVLWKSDPHLLLIFKTVIVIVIKEESKVWPRVKLLRKKHKILSLWKIEVYFSQNVFCTFYIHAFFVNLCKIPVQKSFKNTKNIHLVLGIFAYNFLKINAIKTVYISPLMWHLFVIRLHSGYKWWINTHLTTYN